MTAGGVSLLTLLLAAADGGAVPGVAGGDVAGLGHRADDLRLADGAAHALRLILHLVDAPAAVVAALLQCLQLVGQLGAVDSLRVVNVAARRLSRDILLALLKLDDAERRLLFVHRLFPRGGLLRVVALKRRAAALAFGQKSLVPGSAVGTFHAGKTLPKITLKYLYS